MENLAQILLLLGVGVAVVVVFQRLHIPTSLGYLLVGIILGPYTIGPSVYAPEFRTLGEFGVVFLLFTIGLNFSLPQLQALRHQVLGFGTGQVFFTTAAVGLVLWLAGLAPAAAFVFGAVFAQSSTSIIGSQLNEQGEANTHHGRFGLAMSVFQDVTAVPFLVIIPVLGMAVGASVLATALGWALVKAALAIAVVFFAGRWLLRPLFQIVTKRRSAEVFTLTVLLIALLSAWVTNQLGLSLAFGAFLAGMMLGETEFRHQVESSIQPFRDVLLGLFFVGIGMRFDPMTLPPIWHWTVLGALLILASKILIVNILLRRSQIDARVALRTGLLLAVGGEFGLALAAIAIDSNVIDMQLGQIAMTSVLFSMIAGAVLIRFNGVISAHLSRAARSDSDTTVAPAPLDDQQRQVLIAGYGRVGHTVAVLLKSSGVPFTAFDINPERVAQGLADGYPVVYGDITDPGMLEAIGVARASLVVVTIDQTDTALRMIAALNRICPQVAVIARAKDLAASSSLIQAGAVHAYPETIEASLRLGAAALKILQVPDADVDLVIQEFRDWDYQPVAEAEQNK